MGPPLIKLGRCLTACVRVYVYTLAVRADARDVIYLSTYLHQRWLSGLMLGAR